MHIFFSSIFFYYYYRIYDKRIQCTNVKYIVLRPDICTRSLLFSTLPLRVNIPALILSTQDTSLRLSFIVAEYDKHPGYNTTSSSSLHTAIIFHSSLEASPIQSGQLECISLSPRTTSCRTYRDRLTSDLQTETSPLRMPTCWTSIIADGKQNER